MSGWHIRIMPTAERHLAAIRDRREQQAIVERINRLQRDPDKQGKPLARELAGYRSIRAVGQRYRIIYRTEAQTVAVYVVAIGRRREGAKDDVYSRAQDLLRAGLLEPE